MSEAFIYLWYDAPNDMYYLGKHKGSPDDSYTHSSTIWERFTKDNIPEGVTRRILAYGTDEEMCVLEHELLVNRKERCWDRYYNNSLGDPRYVDQWGKNNHMWKNGLHMGRTSPDKEVRRLAEWKRDQDPKRKAQNRRRHNKWAAKNRAKKKAERQGVGTLEGFWKV